MKEQSAASGILATAIDRIKEMVDCQTIIGETIDAGDGIKIIPISKVTYGFASGGSDFPTKTSKELFGGGGGAGTGHLRQHPQIFALSSFLQRGRSSYHGYHFTMTCF